MPLSAKSAFQVREPRALTEEERTLIQWMLSEARAFNFIEQLGKSRVLSSCDCGCASINLEVAGCPAPTGGLRTIGDFVYGDESSLQGAFVFEGDGLAVQTHPRGPRDARCPGTLGTATMSDPE